MNKCHHLGRVFCAAILIQSLGVAAYAAIGNVWHVPVNAQPSGVPSMRNPLSIITPLTSVTNYNGSFSLDGDQSGGQLLYRRSTDATWSTNTLSYDTINGNDKFWKTVIPAGFNVGDVVQYYFRITFTDRDTTFIYGNNTQSFSTATESVAASNAFSFRVLLPWPGGATAGYASDPASRIHHYKEQAVVGNGYILCMLDANGTLYDIYFPSIGNRQGSGTANEGYKGPEEFIGGPFGCGTDKQANGQMNVIAGMAGIGLVTGGTNSIHWLKNQTGTDYTDVGQQWSGDETLTVLTSNRLTVAGNDIQVIQYDFVPATNALPVVADATRTNRAVYIKRVLLINREATARTVDFYYDVNFNIKGANIDDGMYWESTAAGTNYSAMVAYDNTARTITGEGCNANGYGDDGSGNFLASANYKMVSASSYDRNNSVYFATVLKHVTNTVTGAGEPADGSWRDHTATDAQEGWLGKRITIPAGQTNEVDIMIVGSWDDAPGQTGTHNVWGRPLIPWFYTNSMAAVQQTTDAYWSDWLSAGVTIDLPGTYYDRLFKRKLLISVIHQDVASGAIIAGSHNGAYPFSWPRDGCYAAIAFARLGHPTVAAGYLGFLDQVAFRDTSAGFKSHFFQKYTTNGYKVWSAAQPDESASVPWAVNYLYQLTGDAAQLAGYTNLAFSAIHSVGFAPPGGSPYDANLYFDETYNLVHGNNVWEDSNALFIYSNASIVRGLRDAALIADAFNLSATATAYRARADLIRTGIDARIDARVEPADISHLGMVYPYDAYAANDARMTNMVEWIHGRQAAGGYTDNLVENDTVNYPDIVGLLNRYAHNVNGNTDNYWNTAPGAYLHSPWFLATSWYGMYFARWQDYVGGKALINTNFYTLNLLTNKMDHMLIGAEQIAPKVSLQKYPGFWLQTSWPNLWEADLTLVDQIMMFLDYKPVASNNTCYFAPKLPSAWTTMGFSNLLFRAHRFDVGVTENTGHVRLDFNKRTSGALNIDTYLRLPAFNPPTLIVTNGNPYVPVPADYDLATGRVHIQGPLKTATGNNALVVYYGTTDTVGDGIPDWWRILYYDPTGSGTTTNSQSCATCDGDGDGQNAQAEYRAGTNPTDPANVLQIITVNRLLTGDTVITWKSVIGKQYVVQYSDQLTSGFADLSSTNTATGVTMSYTNNPVVAARYYRVKLVP
ncbi:MAG: hypothetical protein PCFJNLEI_04164 [Verrucomicrobiae bacterium]|nr:hypothetical protein [Verrucomicrobiae bacterium]